MSMSKVNIQEANTHLRELHKKVLRLENKIHMQAMHIEEMEVTNQSLQQSARVSTSTLNEKDDIIMELTEHLEKSETHVQKLLDAAQERDCVVVKLEQKARLFYEVVEHKSVLGKMVQVLDELSEDGEGRGRGVAKGAESASRDGGGSNDDM